MVTVGLKLLNGLCAILPITLDKDKGGNAYYPAEIAFNKGTFKLVRINKITHRAVYKEIWNEDKEK